MSDTFIRHLISIVGTLLALLLFFIGYAAGVRGWWAVGIIVLAVYLIVFKLVDV